MNIPQVPKDITDAKQMQDYMTGIQKALTQKEIDDAKLSQDKTNTTDSLDAKITAVGDGIIESGSNTNGRYIKFRDGTMICWSNKSLGVSLALTTAYGASYYGEHPSMSFPVTFFALPIVSFTFDKASGGITKTSISGTPDISGTGTIYVENNTSQSNLVVYLSYTAIGRWKA